MIFRKFGIYIFFLTVLGYSQPVDVSGTIIDRSGTGVSGCEVLLSNSNLSTTTGNDGVFNLTGIYTSVQARRLKSKFSLDKNFLHFFSKTNGQSAVIEVYDLKGEQLFKIRKTTHYIGNYSIHLSEFNISYIKNQVYIFKISIGGESYSLKYFSNLGGQTKTDHDSYKRPLQKKSKNDEVANDLVINCPNRKSRTRSLNSLSQILGTIKIFAQPNIIVILADDMGYADMGVYGSGTASDTGQWKKTWGSGIWNTWDKIPIETPRLDKMANEGTRFTSFYSQPVCGPARAALLTGSYPMRVAENGNINRHHPILHPDEITIPEILKAAGYSTAMFGKWHLGTSSRNLPLTQGFDYWWGAAGSNDPGHIDLWENNNRIGQHGLTNITKEYTDKTIEYIGNNKSNPFFIYLAHTMPHTALAASDQFRNTTSRGLYGDVISEIDWNVGRIIDTLETLDLEDNTVVVFLSDNGPWLLRQENGGTSFPLRMEKTTTWEAGLRVPFIVRAPGLIPSGSINHEIASAVDLLPTISDLSKGSLPPNRKLDGKNIWPLITGEPGSHSQHDYIPYFYDTHLQALRSGKWKIVLKRPSYAPWLGDKGQKGTWRWMDLEEIPEHQLYDLEVDMGESTDLATNFPDVVDSLLIQVGKAQKDLGDYYLIGEGQRFFEGDSTSNRNVAQWVVYRDTALGIR